MKGVNFMNEIKGISCEAKTAFTIRQTIAATQATSQWATQMQPQQRKQNVKPLSAAAIATASKHKRLGKTRAVS